MQQPARLTFTDGTVEFALVDAPAPDGSRVVRPDTSLDAIRARSGSEPVTDVELAAFHAQLPTDPD